MTGRVNIRELILGILLEINKQSHCHPQYIGKISVSGENRAGIYHKSV